MSKLSGKLMQMAFMKRATEKRSLEQREKEEAEKRAAEETKQQAGEQSEEEEEEEEEEETVNASAQGKATEGGQGEKKACKIVYVNASQVARMTVGRMSFASCNPAVDRLQPAAVAAAAVEAKKKAEQELEAMEKDVTDVDMSAAFRRGPSSPDVASPKKKKRKL